MNTTWKVVLRIALTFVVIALVVSLSDRWTATGPQLVTSAQAYIGNPLTPLSYAGVARRTARRQERREYYYGTGGGAPYGYGGAPYGAPHPMAIDETPGDDGDKTPTRNRDRTEPRPAMVSPASEGVSLEV
jgi:hypothetical protein